MGGYCTGARPKSLSYLLSRAVYIQTPHDKSCFIFPGGPRRSYRRSFGAYARSSHFSAICLLAAASSQWRHIVYIRYKRWSEWCRLRQPNRFLPLRAGLLPAIEPLTSAGGYWLPCRRSKRHGTDCVKLYSKVASILFSRHQFTARETLENECFVPAAVITVSVPFVLNVNVAMIVCL